MRAVLIAILAAVRSRVRSRAALEAEILALRHQLAVLQQAAPKRPCLTRLDRLLWVWLSRTWRDWRVALAIVKPETVIAWHRKGFRLFWTWQIRRGRVGRPAVSRDMMRPDQLQMLDDLAERLADTFLIEADPDNWTAGGKLPTEMSREERGERHWDRKGAIGTGAVLKYVIDIKTAALGRISAEQETQDERDGELDSRIEQAHKRAEQAMNRAVNNAKKAAFDKRVHERKG